MLFTDQVLCCIDVDVYNERREELKKDVDEMELKELTLQPRCIAKYMRELHRTSVTAAKKQTNNNNKQSMKANDNASESSVIILDAPPPIRQRRQSWAGPSST